MCAEKVNNVITLTPDTSLPLLADVQYFELYSSDALNRKMKNIVLPGFYCGFEPVPGGGLTVRITSEKSDGRGAASVDVNECQISVQQIDDVIVPVKAGKTTIIVLEANYQYGVKTNQVDSSSKVSAARIIPLEGENRSDNQIEVCRVVVPAEATDVTADMIITKYRWNRALGIEFSSELDSDEELKAATPLAVKKLKTLIDTKAPIDSPELTGTPTAPTAAPSTNNNQIANTAFVRAAIAALVGSSPEALDTLNELAAALGNDPNFATTMTNALAGKQPLDATLTALAGLATGANKLPYFTGKDTVAQTDLTSVGRDILAKSSTQAIIQYLGLGESVNLASGALQKNQNGADIPDKNLFVRNIGAAKAASGNISIGGDSNNWTTAQFIEWLESQGAFNHPYWMCKGSWAYAANKIITDTGCGNIQLSGAVVEVMGVRGAMTIRITTPTTATNGGTVKAQFTYINHGDAYAPGWRRDFSRDGDSMTGLLTLANISQPLRTPGGGILANDGNLYIKKAGFEGWIDTLFLKLTGGTLTGPLGFQNSNGKVFRVQTTETPSLNTYMQIWGSSSRPTVIELKDENGYHFYSQRNTDNSITMRVNGEVVSGAANAFRAVYGNYGFFIRNDGTTTYFLLTNSGDQLGGWGPLRPLYFSNTTGRVTLGNGVDINNGAVINGGVGLGVTNALGGNSIVLGDNDTGFKQNGDGILDVYANSQRVFRFQNGVAIAFKNIQAGDSKTFSLSSSNTSTKNATFNLWGASTRPVVAELGDEAGWHFYSQRNTDNSVIFSVNGQIQPSNWGNFDSRYVKDVRLGTRVVQLMARGGRYEKAGHAITGLRIIGEVDGDDEAIFRPIQKYINDTWYNVAQV